MTSPDDPYGAPPPPSAPTGHPPARPYGEPPDAGRPYAEPPDSYRPYAEPPGAHPYGYGPGRSGPYGRPQGATPSGIYVSMALLYVFAAGGLLIGLYSVVEGSRVRSLNVAGLSDAGSAVIAVGAFFLASAVADVLIAAKLRTSGGRIAATVVAGLWAGLWLLGLLGSSGGGGAAPEALLAVIMLGGCAGVIAPLWTGPARDYYTPVERR